MPIKRTRTARQKEGLLLLTKVKVKRRTAGTKINPEKPQVLKLKEK